MQIRVDNQQYNFANSADLFAFLKQVNAPVILFCERPEPALLEALCDYLRKNPERSQTFSVAPTLEDADKTNTLLTNLRFVIQHQQSALADLRGRETVNQKSIRKSKINLVTGITHSISIQHEQQQQQQQQQDQQQQIASAQPQRRREKKERPLGLINTHEPLETADSLGILIEEHNIYEHFRNPDRPRNLRGIWFNLVGSFVDNIKSDYWHNIHNFDRKITHVQFEAMKKIIEHHGDFSFGVMFQNLPAGFYLQKVNDPEMHVLCYDESLYQQQTIKNPLTIRLSLPDAPEDKGSVYALIASVILAKNALSDAELVQILQGDKRTLNQFLPDYARWIKQLSVLLSPAAHLDKKTKALEAFVEAIIGSNPAGLEHFKTLLSSFSQDSELMAGLIQVLVQKGIRSLERLLEHLNALRARGGYEVCRSHCFTSEQAILKLSTESGLSDLQELAAYDDTQKNWWESLLTQHAEAEEANLDFEMLFSAWRFFLSELTKLGITKLPQACPIRPIKNMMVALDRTLYILKNASNPQEQLYALHRLDFGPNGAWIASCFDGYDLITHDMHLSYAPPMDDPLQKPFEYDFPDEVAIEYTHRHDWISVYQFKPWHPDLLNTLEKLFRNKPGTLHKVDINSEEGKVYDGLEDPEFHHRLRFNQHGPLVVYSLKTASNETFYFSVTAFINKDEHYIFVASSGEGFSLTNSVRPYLSEEVFNKTVDVPHLSSILLNNQGNFVPVTSLELISFFEKIEKKDNLIQWYYRFLGNHSIDTIQPYRQIAALVEETPLIDRYKAKLLGLCALFATGPWVLEDPIKQCRAFIEAYANPLLKESVRNELTTIFALPDHKQPTITQCTRVLNWVVETKAKTLMANFIKACQALPCAGLDMNQILNLIDQRQQLDSKGIYNNLPTKPARLFNAIAFTLKKLPLHKSIRTAWAHFLPLLNEGWQKDSLQRAMQLGTIIHTMQPPELAQALLSVLTEINIEQCARLPNIADITGLITLIESKRAELPTDYKPRDVERFIQEIITNHLPHLTIGQQKVSAVTADLLDIIRSVFNNFNPYDLIQELLSQQEYPAPLIRYVFKNEIELALRLIRLLQSNSVDMEEVFKIITKLEKDVFKNLNHKLMLPLKGLISEQWDQFRQSTQARENFPMIANQSYKEFLKAATFLPLIKGALELRYNKLLDTNLMKLQIIQHEAINHYFAFHRPALGIDKKLSIKDQIDSYSADYECLNSLINELLIIKHKDPYHYRLLLRCLNNGSGLARLNPSQLWALLHAFNQQAMPAVIQMDDVFEQLALHENVLPEQKQRALNSLNELIKIQSEIEAPYYQQLLRLSLKHNLSHATPFPLDAIIQLKGLNQLSTEDAQALFSALIQLINITTDEAMPSLIGSIETLIEQVKTNPASAPLFIHLLKQVPIGNTEAFAALRELNDAIPQSNPDQADWLCILMGMKTNNIQDMIDLKNRLLHHQTQWHALSMLFRFRPYPPLPTLLDKLAGDSASLEAYIQGFDLNPNENPVKPKSLRDVNNLKNQFSGDRIAAVVSQVARLHGDRINRQLQFELAQDLTYLNAIGKDYAFTIGEERCDNLTQASRESLQRYFKTLLALVRQPALDKKSHHRHYLHLLAVMRELYFRATGLFPYTTQMLVLLLALHDPANLILQINTGEGKGIITALLAVLLWAKGGTVDVLTANHGLIAQDYEVKGSSIYFESLDISSASFDGNSVAGTRRIGGINYTTMADLSIYRQSAKLRGEPLNDEINHKPRPMHLINDESDSTILDNRIMFNVSINGDDSDTNPYAWVYPLINRFIDSEDYRRIRTEQGIVWSSTMDIQKLKAWLGSEAQTDEQRNQLMDITTEQYNRWLDAAGDASSLHEGVDYIVKKEETLIDGESRESFLCIPLIDNNPQFGNSFSGGVQQFLQAREAAKEPSKRFIIESERRFVSSESAKNVLNDYLASGRIIGLSGTPAGTLQENLSQKADLDLNAWLVPPHQPIRRLDYGTHITTTPRATFRRIRQLIQQNQREHQQNQAQPMLFVCEDIKKARALHEQLNAWLQPGELSLQLITGEEKKDDLKVLTARAEESGMITVTTALMGRGTDIIPNHEDGLWLVQTYLDTERVSTQNIGRASRNGQLGRYSAVYYEHDLPHYHDIDNIYRMNTQARDASLNVLRKRMNEEHAVERYYTHQVASINQIIIEQFDQWQDFFIHANSQDSTVALNKWLLDRREVLISTLSQRWTELLNASNPGEEFKNPYVRRNANLKLDTVLLDQALHQFQEDAQSIWSDMLQNQLRIKAQITAMSEINHFRAQTLATVDIQGLVQTRNQRKRQRLKAEQSECEANIMSLSYALSPQAAVVALGEGRSEEEFKEAAISQLREVRIQFNSLVNRADIKSKDKANLLMPEFDNVDPKGLLLMMVSHFTDYGRLFKNKLKQKYKMQPLTQALLTIADSTGLSNEISVQNKLKILHQDYQEGVMDQVADQLEKALDWAIPTQEGLSYQLERRPIQEGARKILAEVLYLKSANPSEKRKGMKRLYQQLHEQQIKLEQVWTLSLGHDDTRKVIAKTLRLIDNTALIADLPPSFRQDAQEAALRKVYWSKLVKSIDGLKVNPPAKWSAIRSSINAIGQNDPGIYAFNQVLAYLKQEKQSAQSVIRSPLLKPLQSLINHLHNIINTISKKAPRLWSESRFLQRKEIELTQRLNQIEGVKIDSLTLTAGHTGFKDYFELTLNGQINHAELTKSFTRYPGKRHNILVKELENIHTAIGSDRLIEKQAALKNWLEKELPQIMQGHDGYLSLHDCFSDELNSLIQPINDLIRLLLTKTPLAHQDSVVEQFSEVRHEINDYLALEQKDNQSIINYLSTLENNKLPSVLDEMMSPEQRELYHLFQEQRELQNKIDKEEQEGGKLIILAYRLRMNMLTSIIHELRDKLTQDPAHIRQFEINKKEALNRLELKIAEPIHKKINERLYQLQEQMSANYQQINTTMDCYQQKIDILHQALGKEEEKLTLMSRRFDTMEELLAFDVELSQLPQKMIDAPKDDNQSSYKI